MWILLFSSLFCSWINWDTERLPKRSRRITVSNKVGNGILAYQCLTFALTTTQHCCSEPRIILHRCMQWQENLKSFEESKKYSTVWLLICILSKLFVVLPWPQPSSQSPCSKLPPSCPNRLLVANKWVYTIQDQSWVSSCTQYNTHSLWDHWVLCVCEIVFKIK